MRGDAATAFADARFTVDQRYTTPTEHHNPIEPHAVIAIWHDTNSLSPTRKHLTLHDANQGAMAIPFLLGPLLGLLPTQIEVLSPYVGGSFGTKGMPHPHIVLAAMAAKLLKGRAVKCVLTRQQMFVATGYRPQSHQHVRLAADADGRLSAIEHHAVAPTARFKEFAEQTATPARMMYATPNLTSTHRLIPLDVAAGTFMRAPGEFTGMFALETALDELADTIGIDPIELRLRNEPEVDPGGWQAVQYPQPRPMPDRGCRHVRLGCARVHATGEARGRMADRHGRRQRDLSQPAYPQHARTDPLCEGTVFRGTQASDIGTGARTILGQIGADALGVEYGQVDVELGRTGLPFAILAGGSMGTYTWGNSILAAAAKFRRKFGRTRPRGETDRRRKTTEGLQAHSRHAFGATFAEVRVSAVTGEVRVARMLGIYAAGRIINPRTANSQFVGGMTMGLSAALHEDSVIDPRFGHVVNADLAGYHIAAHADVVDIRAQWIDEFDPYFGPTGAKGIGELGIVGVPAAIGNAIYNASGKRLRDLPFTPDKLLM